MDKTSLRNRIWSLMEERQIARFPRPVFGRIPNFVGAEIAAEHLSELRVYKDAKVIKVNPDSPQRPIREMALRGGKTLITPSPRMRKGFIMIRADSNRLDFKAASTIKGSFRYGKLLGLDEIPMIDLIVVGSVAVSEEGVRLGKGGGYGDLEYGMLRELDRIGESTQVLTTIHDLQIVEDLEREAHDMLVDHIVTPKQTIDTARSDKQPEGVFWERIDQMRLEEIPLLKELKIRVH